MTERVEGRTLKGYHVLDKVGQGGMTSVYKALDLERNRIVALKILSPYIAQDPNFKARFEREIQVLLKLRHENIVPILDYGEEDPYAFIVMPFVASGTLQDRLRRDPLTPYEGSRIVEEVVQALAFAHQQGVVHRDVKPSNILLTDDGRALLSDFGFAHVRELSHSLTGSALIGTPAYMSPEQCRGDEIDERSDQYSLGVVLYQLCTGRLPFDADTPMALAVQHINEPLVHPRKLNPELPEPVSKVLLKALAKEPGDRFRSIEAMNEAFQQALSDSVDEYGNFMPAGLGATLTTWVMDKSPLGSSLATVNRWWKTRRLGLIAGVLALLMLPGAGYGIANLLADNDDGDRPRVSLQGGGNAALQATIDAMSTELALSGVDQDLIQVAVAGTLSSQSRTESGRVTPTPGQFETLSANQATESGLGFFNDGGVEAADDEDGSGDGGGDSKPPAPTATPTPTPTSPPPTSTPTPTPQPTATDEPATATPEPTATPREINPNACQDSPDHANYCTPTPQPAG